MMIHLVLGGSRSGKSRYAERLANHSGRQITFVATCTTTNLDPEMRARIKQHRLRRPASWITVENRFDLNKIVREFSRNLILLDCLTLWLSHHLGKNRDVDEILEELEMALREIQKRKGHAIFVSNELGLGLVPMGAKNRKFRDLCGRANQLVASQADRVEFMIAGIPLLIKGKAG